MFEKKVKEEKKKKIHDLNLQPRTCSHPINARPFEYDFQICHCSKESGLATKAE